MMAHAHNMERTKESGFIALVTAMILAFILILITVVAHLNHL